MSSSIKKASKAVIWIDVDNSPHVPFFKPIIRELVRRDYEVFLTARDAFQVYELIERSGLSYILIGRHHGKNKIAKVVGLFLRALQLMPKAGKAKPALAVSHGSRAQIIASNLLHIPSLLITDYEHAKFLPLVRPRWTLVPEVIPDNAMHHKNGSLKKYPGIKEDVYVPTFQPDANIIQELGLDGRVVVTLRPPATEAHYHNHETDKLFDAVMHLLKNTENVQTVLLPRNKKQEEWIRRTWPACLKTDKLIIPAGAVDGLNLLWHSDLVISGGGTMNREAAALGVPVYSIFRGQIGAVDRYLAQTNRLILLESDEDVKAKIRFVRRCRTDRWRKKHSETLFSVVESIISTLEHEQKGPAL
jgi:predicted glycosyltransferase